jgi:CRISPR-associated protein Cas10/Csm1 subtype III-A
MESKKREIIIGALLHDIGKVSYRAGQLQNELSHSVAGLQWFDNFVSSDKNKHKIIRDAIRYHHRGKMINYGIDYNEDDPVFLISMADHISAKADRRENIDNEEHEENPTLTTLTSIYSQIDNKNSEIYSYDGTNIYKDKKTIPYPLTTAKISKDNYYDALSMLKDSLKGNLEEDGYLNSLVNVISILFKYFPSDTRLN